MDGGRGGRSERRDISEVRLAPNGAPVAIRTNVRLRKAVAGEGPQYQCFFKVVSRAIEAAEPALATLGAVRGCGRSDQLVTAALSHPVPILL